MVSDRGVTKVAAELGISAPGLRAHLVREGLPTRMGQDHVGGHSFTIEAADLPASQFTPDSLLKSHGLDPKKWRIVRVRANRWGDEDDPKIQLRVDVEPNEPPFEFPSIEKWKPITGGGKPKPKREKGDPEIVIVVSDQHAPFHSKPNHRLLCRFLEDEKPDRIIIAGDLLDFPDVSRHRTIPGDKFDASVNECLQAGFEILADYRHAAGEECSISFLPGNHDVRLAHKIIDQATKVWNIRAANDEVPALSLRRLLHLDFLGVEYVDETDWQRAKIEINSRLTVRHGFTTSKNPGPKILAGLSGSTIQGHSHRTSSLYTTAHGHDGPEFRVAAETGCLCEIEDGLGYATEVDWQPAFLRVAVWEDDFLISTCLFLNGPNRLLIPDGRRYIDNGG